MKYKNVIFAMTVFASMLVIFTGSEINAQTRRAAAKKLAQPKNKIIRSKSAKPRVVSKEAMVIGKSNRVLVNPPTNALTKPNLQTPPRKVSMGIINGKAVSLAKPSYPPAAKAVGASGTVNVQVTVDEEGNVIAAKANSGHPLLRSVAEQAARDSKFSPTKLSGQPVKVTGIIVYNFVAE